MLRTSATRSLRAAVTGSQRSSVRYASTGLKEVLYTAESRASGSRAAGVASNDATGLKLDLAMPKGEPSRGALSCPHKRDAG